MRRIGLAVLVAAGSIAGAAALGIGDAAQGLGADIVMPTHALAQGEGIDDAPPLIGSGTQIADYRTAARLYNFISSEMPNDDPGSLSSREYYDVLAYILDQNDMNPSGQPVNQSTAADIPLN